MAIRILHIVSSLARANGVSGCIMNYYRGIDRSKFQFDILFFTDNANSYREEFESLGGRAIKIDRPSITNFLTISKQLHQLFAQNRYSIIHCHVAQIGLLLFPIAYRHSVESIILHSHNSRSSEIRYKQIRNSVMNRLSSMLATHHFACSREAAEALFSRSEIQKGIFVMNNAVDVNRFRFSPDKRAALREELGVDKDRVLIGNIGRCCIQKNQLLLIDIFNTHLKRHSQSTLVIVGDGAILESLKARANELGISNNIIFTDVRKDIDCIVSALDIMVMPSLFEGLPVTGIEAQTAGLPCLFASSITKDVKVNSNTSFQPLESSHEAWSEAIEELLKQGREANAVPQINAAGFNIALEISKLESHYQDIISAK